MAKKKGKQENKPTLGQFLSTRAAEVRDSYSRRDSYSHRDRFCLGMRLL